ncbi:MAG: ABC transporter ATP-binding protein [Crocosphaera sp.]|uniref:ABC transporter ATP-binding protein n=1 Tax=Crocosphaera sp. TaxID=2729996 RepID=UPI003F275A39|nr:ABC transporter ATP-binding protein [Crocosphaera sp.]
MSDLVLDVSNLTVKFPPQGNKDEAAVDNVNFQLKKGEILGIVGESGSGKSVTSLAIMGLIQKPGKIVEGSRITYYKTLEKPTELTQLEKKKEEPENPDNKPKKWTDYRGEEIAMIFQEPMSAFNPVYTIGYQLVEMIQEHQGVTQEQAKNQVIDLLQQVKVLDSDQELEEKCLQQLEEINRKSKSKKNIPTTQKIKNYIRQQKEACLKRYPHELSGGQLQRVMIAMAISCEPKILIADEPTTALDVTVQKGILKLLRGLCKNKGIAMIFISHDLGVINEVADRILVMCEGKVIEEGKKEQILRHPQDNYTKGLLACRPPLHIKVDKLPTVADFSEDKKGIYLSDQRHDVNLIDKIGITDNQIQTRNKAAKDKEVLLSVENLTVEYGKSGFLGLKPNKSQAVKNISFEVYSGETLGLVGESGCGKSTLARTILRLISAANGNISFEIDELSDKSISKKYMNNEDVREFRKNMQIVFQNPYSSLNPRLTIGEAIAEPMIIHQTQPDSEKRREIVNALLNLVGLDASIYKRYPHQFSGGQRQRVCIARALALNPRFLICDESVSALDVSVQAQVLNLLKDLQRKLKLTCIFISHDLSVVRFMSDRIMVMQKGEIVEIGDAEKIVNNPQQQYTKDLLNSIPQFPEDLKWELEDTVNSSQSS